MPKSKKKHCHLTDEADDCSADKLQKLESAGNSSITKPEPSSSRHSAGEKNISSEELAIGSTVCHTNTKEAGTVGPFVRIKETGELCFLTVRHIFGPFQDPRKFLGTRVLLRCSNQESRVCGSIIAAEYSESLDVALVKVSENCNPSEVGFTYITDENFRETGLHPAHISLDGNVYGSTDLRGLTPNDIEKHRLIKISNASGLTVGQLSFQNGNVTNDYTVVKEGPNYTFTQILTYKKQLLVVQMGEKNFAKEEDVGAAVYLVDNSNKLHLIGMICGIRESNQGVLVTPIQDIMSHLERQLKKTLEVVTFNSGSVKAYDNDLFTRALKEGEEQDRHLRVNIIGFYAQGKTTLTRRLFSESLRDIESTDGIDVHVRRCKIKENSWEKCETEQEFAELSHRLVSVAREVETKQSTSGSTVDEGYGDDVLDLTKEDEIAGDTFVVKDIYNRKSTLKNEHNEETNVFYGSEPSAQSKEETETSVKNQQLFRHFSEELNERDRMTDNELIATIWDFGGQFVYYATHQIFHSRDAVYLLVFDLRKGLENVLEDYDYPDRQEKMKTSLMFWVNSINAFVGTDDGTKPKIILVGTHKDKFKGNIEAKFKEVKDLFAGTGVRNHIYERTFAVASVDMNDNVINYLRQTIYKIGEETASGRRIPAKWIPLEMSLLEKRQRNIITFQAVIEMDAKNDYPIKNEEEIKAFLKYHHEKGTLVFFDEDELRNHVILSPQFLVDAFRCIITSKTICDGSDRLHRLWKKMTNMAVLEKEIIDAVWSEDKNADFFRLYDILLNFLKRHRILAELLQIDENSGKLIGLGKYMIPSFLKNNCSDETADSFLFGKSYSSNLLGLCLENNTVLATVYERITAAALGRWPPIKFEDQYLVFQNVGYYRLDRQHAGRITKKDGEGIELMVIVVCPSGEDIAVVSDRFRRYVEMVIDQEFSKLHRDNRGKLYRHYIKCNHPDHGGKGSKESHSLENIRKEIQVCCPDYKNHPIDVKTTVEEWFQETKISVEQESTVRLVTEMDLIKIAQAIGMNWELLGIALGLSSDKIERIRQNNRDSGTATVIFYMLKEWRNQNPKHADQKLLMKAVRETHTLSVNWDRIRNFLDNF